MVRYMFSGADDLTNFAWCRIINIEKVLLVNGQPRNKTTK
ncbi:hypothetical protein SELSPUOL_01473 [Selenomonas sputigena ATCC 35185]|uniref:Uncharacterized protein n=1 Tax=Selenomonas sputigena (strain ATCC 35185 / DSM 20758 / CCUG 44933 / VPI D19B-28) TaxID=546271 RepID=C9LVH9_SELS3|nr:hypothetical protein SELSPUOL_01473 [Selenomonas sputigena ATCC 35185]